MWESFERRLEAEHYLGPTVRAQELIKQIIDMSVETSEEAFRSKLDPLTSGLLTWCESRCDVPA